MVRHARSEQDAARCAEIYRPNVLEGVASLEEEAPGAEEMAGRIAAVTRTHPWLVTERDGVIAGYAYATSHHVRASYRWATDVTVYVAAEHRRRGVGHELYAALLELVRAQGFRVACAGVTLPNEASVRLHEAFGFVPVGVYRNIAWKFGSWYDVGWWQLQLLPAADERPPEPGPPATAAA
jgi:L-amino acid N-acyltransferase YncA